MKGKNCLILLLLFLSLGVAAQKVSFHASAPLSVDANERFSVEFRLDGAASSNFTAPKFSGCEVLTGPFKANGATMININGVQSSSIFETFTYVLQAKGGSKITISSANVTANGKGYSSTPLTINVGSGGGAPSGAASPSSAGATTKLTSSDVLLRMTLSKNKLYKGEALLATLKLYMRVGISGLQNPKYPTFNGFWTQELDVSQTPPARETLDGKVYEVQPIRQWLLYPQKSGTLEVEQSSLDAIIQVVTRSASTSLFDNFMGGGAVVDNVNRTLIAPALKVQVNELPKAGAPVDHSAPVGKFTMTSESSSSEMTANAAGWVKVTLSGTGDFPLLEAPTFKLPAAFEQYDTKMTESIRNSTGGTTGSRTWEFPFIARAEGEYTLPQIEVTYFDPSSASYKTLTSNIFKVKVLRDPTGGKNSAAVVAGMTKEDVQMVGSDVRHIKRGGLDLVKSDSLLLFSALYFALLALIVGLFIGALIFLKKRIARRADVAGRKHRKASKVATARLRKARSFMDSNNRSAFFEETLRAMWGYLGDKFTLEQSALDKQTVRGEFMSHSVEDAVADEFMDVIESCELAQYAPAGEVSMQEVYNKALSVIDKI